MERVPEITKPDVIKITPPQSTPLEVLLVEDDPGDSLLVEVSIKHLNCPVNILRAATLAEAVAHAKESTPIDVALVDLSLPDSFGMPTVQSIREAFPHVPIIVLTGLDDASMEEQIVSSGAQDYLIKGSFRGDALTRAIRHALTRHRLEQRLAESEARNRALIEIAPDAILVVALDGTIMTSNPAAAHMFGADAQAPLDGQKLDTILPDAPALLAKCPRDRSLRQDGTALRQGLPFPVSMAAASLDDGSTMLLVSDMTERASLTQRLQELARTDPLTGLANRRAFIEIADVEFHRFQRTGLVSALLMIDIDHFKQVNDVQGHQAGDDALVRLSSVLSGKIRITDMAVRYGGEEFILLMTGTEIEGAREMAERVRGEVAKISVPGPLGPFGFTVSIGVASFSAADDSWQDTLRRADEALYRAKSEGRNRVITVSPILSPAKVSGPFKLNAQQE